MFHSCTPRNTPRPMMPMRVGAARSVQAEARSSSRAVGNIVVVVQEGGGKRDQLWIQQGMVVKS